MARPDGYLGQKEVLPGFSGWRVAAPAPDYIAGGGLARVSTNAAATARIDSWIVQ